MSKKFVYLGSALAAVSYYEYTRYMKILDAISAKPSNIKIKKQGENLLINFTLNITNTTGKSLELDKVFCTLLNKGEKLAVFITKNKNNIRANSTTKVNVSGLTSPKQLMNLIDKGGILTNEYTLQTRATLRFNMLGILSIPLNLNDTTQIKAAEIFADINNIIDQFKILFKK